MRHCADVLQVPGLPVIQLRSARIVQTNGRPYVVINNVSLTDSTRNAVALIDSQETGYVICEREDGVLFAYKCGTNENVFVVTDEQVVEFINGS